MKSIVNGWKKLSFNQKVTLILVAAGVVATWMGYFESRKERIKAEQAHAETQKLTEQNKQIAIKTVQSFIAGGGPIISELSDLTNYYNSLENLLTTADVPIDERNKILGRTKP